MLTHAELLVRLITAAGLGAVVGLERERLDWAAGLRTHMLVCLGAALVVIVSAYGFEEVISAQRVVLDPSRIAAQVVSGVGFLGAGTILFLRQRVIRGLTTAASLWVVAAVGLAAGCGMYVAAAGATVLSVVILALLKPVEKWLFRRQRALRLVISIERERASLWQLEQEAEAGGLAVKQLALKHGEGGEGDTVELVFLRSAARAEIMAVAEKLKNCTGVRGITF